MVLDICTAENSIKFDKQWPTVTEGFVEMSQIKSPLAYKSVLIRTWSNWLVSVHIIISRVVILHFIAEACLWYDPMKAAAFHEYII